jgi:hypothetical protein
MKKRFETRNLKNFHISFVHHVPRCFFSSFLSKSNSQGEVLGHVLKYPPDEITSNRAQILQCLASIAVFDGVILLAQLIQIAASNHSTDLLTSIFEYSREVCTLIHVNISKSIIDFQ